MSVTVSQFRLNFPEFTSTVNYPDTQVQFWLDTALLFMNADRWGAAMDFGQQLFAAHNIVLEQQASKTARFGGTPGTAQGVLSSKSVDKVSAGYDVSKTLEENAGHWNLTNYGTRYLRFSRLIGAGAIQIGADLTTSVPVAWYGPPWLT